MGTLSNCLSVCLSLSLSLFPSLLLCTIPHIQEHNFITWVLSPSVCLSVCLSPSFLLCTIPHIQEHNFITWVLSPSVCLSVSILLIMHNTTYLGAQFYNMGTQHGNLHHSPVTTSRVTYFIMWVNSGTCDSRSYKLQERGKNMFHHLHLRYYHHISSPTPLPPLVTRIPSTSSPPPTRSHQQHHQHVDTTTTNILSPTPPTSRH